MIKKTADIRSDSCSKPSLPMLKFMTEAELGIDHYNDDESILSLEK